MDGQILSVIGDVLNAWLPWFGLVAGVAAAFALARFMTVVLIEALGANPPKGTSGDQPLLFKWLAGIDEPVPQAADPVATGPWYRMLLADITRNLRRVYARCWDHIRGDKLNPWWRVSWRGLDRAFTRANWSIFFALFFGAFVCAAAVVSGFPLGATAALYALAGVVWVMMLATITISLWIGELSFLVIGMFCEIGAFFGYVVVGSVIVLAGFVFAALRGRATAYLMTLEQAGGRVWNARIVNQQEAMRALQEMFERNRERYFAQKARAAQRRADRAQLTKAQRLWSFAGYASAIGMVAVMYGFLVIVAQATPNQMEMGALIKGLVIWLLVFTALVGAMMGLVLLEYRWYRKRYDTPPNDAEASSTEQEALGA